MFQEKISIKMKKAISLVLAGALFVGGAAFASTSKAADDEVVKVTSVSLSFVTDNADYDYTICGKAATKVVTGGAALTTGGAVVPKGSTVVSADIEGTGEWGTWDENGIANCGWIKTADKQADAFHATNITLVVNGQIGFEIEDQESYTGTGDSEDLQCIDLLSRWTSGISEGVAAYTSVDEKYQLVYDGSVYFELTKVSELKPVFTPAPKTDNTPSADTKTSTSPSADTKTSTSPSADTKTSTSPSADTKTSTSPSADTKTSTQPGASASVAPAATSAAPAAAVTPTPAAKSSSTNKCTKLKAAKKKYTIKKKGKTVKVVFNITTKNKNKKTTDKIKKVTVAKKKIIKVTKKKLTNKAKSKKATITVKGLKKGTSKLTVKVGSKSASTKVTVKK